MKDMHFIHKLVKLQKKIFDEVDAQKAGLDLGDNFDKLMADAKAWADVADEKPDQDPATGVLPNIDPLRAMANALHLYMGSFDTKTQEHIAEYEELVQHLEME